MLVFGGRKNNSLKTDLIAVNLESLVWFYITVEGGPIVARMSASMVTVKDHIYIFGGLASQAKNAYITLNTFCVAEHTNQDQKWRWIVRDQAYPEHIPSLGYDLGVVPVYDGKKILLIAGRDDDTDVS